MEGVGTFHQVPPPPYDELAVDSPYLSFADNVFNKYRNYYHMQTKGTEQKNMHLATHF